MIVIARLASSCRPRQRSGKVRRQGREIAFDAAIASDKDMIGARDAVQWQQCARQCPQAPFHAVAHHGIADFPGHRVTDAQCGIGVAASVNEQHKARRSDTPGLVGSKEITAQPDRLRRRHRLQAESFLRPWARRLRMTLRPPTVAMRARKPWRRARTSFDG